MSKNNVSTSLHIPTYIHAYIPTYIPTYLQAISDPGAQWNRMVELNVQEQCINLFANPIIQRKQVCMYVSVCMWMYVCMYEVCMYEVCMYVCMYVDMYVWMCG